MCCPKKPFVKKFIGNVTIFSNHSTTIKVGYNTIIHCGAVKKAVKIYKITAVILLKDNEYSKPNKYYLDPITNIIYDYDLHFVIGKIAIDKIFSSLNLYNVPNSKRLIE